MWSNVENELRDDQWVLTSLARSVHHLATTQPTDYEKGLVILDRRRLVAVTETQDGLLPAVLTFFIAHEGNPYNATSVKQTLFIFLWDWMVKSNMQYMVVLMHQPDPFLLMRRTPAELDWRLWRILKQAHDDTIGRTYSNPAAMIDKWKRFWTSSMSTSMFHKSCVALRMLMIQKQEEYLDMFKYTDARWQTYLQDKEQALIDRTRMSE